MSDSNRIYISDLFEKTILNDDDILIIEGIIDDANYNEPNKKNTASVSLANLAKYIVDDNSKNHSYKTYSSSKIVELVSDINKDIIRLSNSCISLENQVADIESIPSQLEEFKTDWEKKLEDKVSRDVMVASLATKRAIVDKIIGGEHGDLETNDDSKKIQMINLSEEVKAAMTGNTKISVSASAPDGGWLGSHISSRTITRNNLSDNYNFVETINYEEANIDVMVKEGLYILGPKVVDVEDRGIITRAVDGTGNVIESVILKVERAGDSYIIQTIYHTSNIDEKPIYIRRNTLNALPSTPFKEVRELSPSYKVGRDMLKDDFLNNGVIYSESIYSYKKEGNYYATRKIIDGIESHVTGLPTENDDYLVTVQKFGDDSYLYIAELISSTTCKIYHSKFYYQNGTAISRHTDWYLVTDNSKSKFDSKYFVLFGDEALYDTGQGSIESILKDEYGILVNSNTASTGATIGDYSDTDVMDSSCIISKIENVSMYDETEYAIIMAGMYDWTSRKSDLSIFKEGLSECISKLFTKKPNIKLILCTPHYKNAIVSKNNGEYYDSDDAVINDMHLQDFIDAIYEIANNYHVPVADLYSTGGINKYTHSVYLDGGSALNDAGNELIAHKIFNAMNYYF